MSAREIAEAVMELSEADRLDLARRIIASVADEQENGAQIASAVQVLKTS